MLFRCRLQVCRVTWCGTGPQLQPEQRAVCSRARQDHWHYHIVFRLDHSNQKSGRLVPQNLAAEPKSKLRWRTLAQGAALHYSSNWLWFAISRRRYDESARARTTWRAAIRRQGRWCLSTAQTLNSGWASIAGTRPYCRSPRPFVSLPWTSWVVAAPIPPQDWTISATCGYAPIMCLHSSKPWAFRPLT